ncbi:motility protein B [Oceanobacillus oncorhynchi subsp. incaldanensis]|uniref:Motility protein B n=2 Tax=Oceanobacillus TaxID=182709 RepID=A0A0A1MDK9_9BACI|nr:flagellar motor protein MotB [Oceanobacillus oncorhynchi]MDM8098797.1 flagellar motor protein MotB [Oceanobacillus oncorhynchi]GIO17922.1 motility protein B [Oceanobacillus oncorhynchi subsp. incaldanensis]CEI81173.1 Motility protein B [Oceanobacillus oncorhynchi]
MARRKRKKKQSHVDESWLLPYSDLLTLLVALFIVLFASSDVNVERYFQLANVFRDELSSGSGTGLLDYESEPIPPSMKEGRDEGDYMEEGTDDEEGSEEETADEADIEGEQELLRLRQVEEEINIYIEEAGLTEEFGTTLTGEGLLVTMRNDILFDSGSAVVKQEGIQVAEDVSQILHTEPPHQVVISGHADDVPIHNADFESNWELSVTRAMNFMQILMQNDDLDPTLFSVKGYGEFEPAFPNDTEEDRARNRRVEVLVLPNYEINVPDETNED